MNMVNLEPNLFLYPAFFLGYRAPFPLCKRRFVPLLCHGTPGPGTQKSAAGLYTRLLLLMAMAVRWCNLFIRVLPRAAHTRGARLVSRYTASGC